MHLFNLETCPNSSLTSIITQVCLIVLLCIVLWTIELGVHIQYSTLANYFDYLYNQQFTYPRIYMDFEFGWPHAIRIYNQTIQVIQLICLHQSKVLQYQTGALTSRPAFKGLIRKTNAFLRPAEINYVLSKALVSKTTWQKSGGDQLFAQILSARRGRALTQHHDSLAGTMVYLLYCNIDAELNFRQPLELLQVIQCWKTT